MTTNSEILGLMTIEKGNEKINDVIRRSNHDERQRIFISFPGRLAKATVNGCFDWIIPGCRCSSIILTKPEGTEDQGYCLECKTSYTWDSMNLIWEASQRAKKSSPAW